MPVQPLPKEVVALIKRYQKAQIDLINIIADLEARGNVTTYRKAVLRAVNQELAILNKYAEGWALETIPKAYKTGVANTYLAFRKNSIDVGKIYINSRVVNNLVANTAGMLTDANKFVGRRINDELRQAGIDAIASKVSTGSTVKEAKRIMLQNMADRGITGIVDKAGRNIKLEAYAETVARTTTREATNKGVMESMTDKGYDLVRMSHHNSSCPVCIPYEGRVYSISGKSKEYPALSEAFGDTYATIHPNCVHTLEPYFPKFDDNAEQLKKQSNRPFEIEERDKKSLERYKADQKEKAQRRRDRNEYLEAKALAPDKAPKTFSGYRSMKRSQNDNFKSLRSEVLDKKKE